MASKRGGAVVLLAACIAAALSSCGGSGTAVYPTENYSARTAAAAYNISGESSAGSSGTASQAASTAQEDEQQAESPAGEDEQTKIYTPDSFRAELLTLINSERTKHNDKTQKTGENGGLCRLVMGDSALTAAAQTRAEELEKLSDNELLAHKRPSGGNWADILPQSYAYKREAAEVISRGVATPAGIVSAWMEDETDNRARALIISDKYTVAAVGYHISEGGTVYCTVIFVGEEKAE